MNIILILISIGLLIYITHLFQRTEEVSRFLIRMSSFQFEHSMRYIIRNKEVNFDLYGEMPSMFKLIFSFKRLNPRNFLSKESLEIYENPLKVSAQWEDYILDTIIYKRR